MTADGAVNVVMPVSTLPELSVPPLAITDGSDNPTWVELPCRNSWIYGRRRRLRLPFDAATADVAGRWLRFNRLQRYVLNPISMALLLAALATPISRDTDQMTLVTFFYMASVSLTTWAVYRSNKVTVAQHPEAVGQVAVYIPEMHAPVAEEWANRNSGVRVVLERPGWRRYRPSVYRGAAGLCAVAGVVLWWFALRDGTFELTVLMVFLLLLWVAVRLALKSLPPGFIRFEASQ